MEDNLVLTEYNNGGIKYIEGISNAYQGNPDCEFDKFQLACNDIVFFKLSKDSLNLIFWDSSGKERYFEIKMISSVKNAMGMMITNPSATQVYDFFSTCKGFM